MTQPETRPQPGGGGLSTKVGPLPTWAWLGIAAAGGVGLLLWLQYRKNAAAAAAPTTNNVTTVPGVDSTDVTGQLATIEAQIRDLQSGQSTAPPTGTTQPTRSISVKGGTPTWSSGYSLDVLQRLNPSFQVAYSDKNGFLKPGADISGAQPTFGSDQTLLVPA